MATFNSFITGVGALTVNDFPIEKVTITIVQPRFEHAQGAVRSYEVKFGTLFEFQEQLVEDANATEQKDAPLKIGDWCRWCAAQAVCPKKNEQALQAVKQAFAEPAQITTTSYSPEKLAATLELLPQVESWCKSVRSFAYNEAKSGRVPPGFKLVEKRPSRKWAPNLNPDLVALELEVLRSSLFTEPEMKSVPQVEKFIKKEHKKTLAEFTIWESSGDSLVPEADKRIEIDLIKKAFDVIETTKGENHGQ